jgi:hypothetical protein
MESRTKQPALSLTSLQTQIEAITTIVQETAERSQGDAIALLALLRALEELHRDICDHHFQAALPDSRQSLYAFLRDIESQGGWPYIPRMKLQTILDSHSEESSFVEQD